jgi:hypothetical protein
MRSDLNELLLSPESVVGAVRPFFYEDHESGALKMCFQCVNCEAFLGWDGTLWRCLTCEFELLPVKAAELLDDAIGVLERARNVARPEQRRRRAWWRRIFPRKRKKRPALPESP